ncbi:MAG TPA: acyl-CoA dehydratase activase, partial [Bacteroidales bacterium]|nr:acyl-CoA dehydratase activase [Bacteroidales bacterium]
SLAEICDGLCYGLAKNVVDAVFEEPVAGKLVFAGGVSLNEGVVKHLQLLLESEVVIGDYSHLYGAIGAALMMQAEDHVNTEKINSTKDLFLHVEKEKEYHNQTLELKLSDYPDFSSLRDYLFTPSGQQDMGKTEVSQYMELLPGKETRVFLGIDIGSTSTKAVITDSRKNVVAGFYTRTSGRPVAAVQCLFEAIKDLARTNKHQFRVIGAGTTGSGRKLVGKIIGADIIPDEITAHARAAVELDPEVDTIIEIGGQDSKFTLLKDGMVSFSIMNNVCAAGTGSFIEEQAHKLDCPLADFAGRAERSPSPLASDRCTVFMERDLNYYLNEGYETDELLASVLHSIRDNYLSKVAGKARIGKRIFFQGATAKNRALVAAFEQKLQKPIMVSKYCHLTGALGVALTLHDRNISPSSFRGLHLWKMNIPVRTEICHLCNNQCKLRVAEVNGETVAYGFLCGRDYDTQKFVKKDGKIPDLTDRYNRVFRYKQKTSTSPVTIGLPSALYLADERLLWQKFFDLLGVKTITSESYTNSVKDGKKLSDAEFCAPLASAFGHVHFLKDKADYIFLPVYLEEGTRVSDSKQYCYYTQYMSGMLASTRAFRDRHQLLTPLVKSLKPEGKAMQSLRDMMHRIGYGQLGTRDISAAYREARKYYDKTLRKWKDVYTENRNPQKPEIILLGRPYTVLNSTMNSNIPGIIASNGYPAYFMNMLPENETGKDRHDELARAVTWKYAAEIIRKTRIIAESGNAYPILITSFKCTPDSFVIDYFREIMDSYNKPYLVLQLDEHDSSVGYETRIEAAIQSFKNHFYKRRDSWNRPAGSPGETVPHQKTGKDIITRKIKDILSDHTIESKEYMHVPGNDELTVDLSDLKTGETEKFRDKILLIPGWDLPGSLMLAGIMKAEGQEAAVIADTDESIRRSLKINTGQCLPLSTIVQNAYEYLTTHNIDPAGVVIWVPRGFVSCNLTMFPHYMKKLMGRYEKRMSQVEIYPGNIAFYDFSIKTGINAYLAFLFSGNLRKVACRIRPYEKHKGSTDLVLNTAAEMLYHAFLHKSQKEPVLKEIIKMFDAVEVNPGNRPKVAIFGDIYVRENDIFNQELVKVIEENGGEVLLTSMSEYLKIIIRQTEKRLLLEGRYPEHYKLRVLKHLIPLLEKEYNRYFLKYIDDIKPLNGEIPGILDKHHLQIMHRGESVENILKIENLIRHYNDISLFVQTSPAYCCPSLVTEAMASHIEHQTGVPVVSIEYDGTKGFKNEAVIPYLKLGG